MILKQHIEIDGLEFDIAIRKAPPANEKDGKKLDAWMRALVETIKGGSVGVPG